MDTDQIKFDFSEPRMTPEEVRVWDVLRMCRGRTMAILGPEIEELTGIRYKHVQKIVNDLRCHHAKLIGSSTRGYYLPQTREEIEAVEHYIKGRAIVALATWGKLKKLTPEEILHQLRMEFQKAG